MDQIKEFFGNAKERLNNPFFFSFILSWFLWNWEITLALFYWEGGLFSLLEYIGCNTDWVHSFLLPVMSAFVYLFFKLVASAIVTWFDKHSDNLNISISKERSVKMNKYLRDRERLDTSLQNLEKIINAENVTQEQLAETTDTNTKLSIKLSEVQTDLSKFQILSNELELKNRKLTEQVSNLGKVIKFREAETKKIQEMLSPEVLTRPDPFDSSMMQGDWTLTRKHVASSKYERYHIFISGKELSISKNSSPQKAGSIEHYHFNYKKNEVFFVKYLNDKFIDIDIGLDGSRRLINRLTANVSFTRLTGIENEVFEVTYDKYIR
ncbi:MAG: hypothetical protein RIF36_11945 [Imperialibacter sp.]|uniref:hypothetical protein n=1 Tax=Imperialibacter sp. TaxID=2038411 RepID=UPI0032EBA19D